MRRKTKKEKAVEKVEKLLERYSPTEIRCCVEFFVNGQLEKIFNKIAREAGISANCLERKVIEKHFGPVGKPFAL